MIQGIAVTLVIKTPAGQDAFNHTVYAESQTVVEDVLVGQPTTDDITDATEVYGKRMEYWLAIPKGDAHQWEDTEVILPEPFPGRYRTFGGKIAGIEANVPTRWNAKIRLERVVG